MTSLTRTTAQISRATGYYVPVGSLGNKIFAEPTVNANGTMAAFSTAAWASGSLATGQDPIFSSFMTPAGANYPGLLKDMGKTLVSAQRTFRKVQMVVSTTSTFGVGGNSGTAAAAGQDYFTGYIELGLEGYGRNAPVASFGR